MIYTVIAYRWGWLNNHFYQVAATQDVDRACDIAREECDGRGGKYGVAVYEWKDDETCALYDYCPSTYGEDRPHDNQRLEMFRSIGHDAHSVATTGVHWAAPEGKSAMEPEAVAIPRWLKQAVQRHEEMSRFMATLMDDLHDRKKAGLPSRDGDEQQAWANKEIARSSREARQLLGQAARKRREAMASWAKRSEQKQQPVVPDALPETGDESTGGGEGGAGGD